MSQDWLKLSVPVFARPPALWHRHCHKKFWLCSFGHLLKGGVVRRLGVTSPVSPTPLHKRLKDALVSAFRAKERLPFSAQHAPHVELFCHDTCVSTEHDFCASFTQEQSSRDSGF